MEVNGQHGSAMVNVQTTSAENTLSRTEERDRFGTASTQSWYFALAQTWHTVN